MAGKPRIGVLALQGAVAEHLQAFEQAGALAVEVRTVEDLAGVDAVVLPGGESTTIGKLLDRFGLLTALKERASSGMPIWGTCAGMILLARTITNGLPGQHSLGLIDLSVERNAFGRQVDSFEGGLDVPALGPEPFPAVFIRAPLGNEAGEGVEVLARHQGRIAAARQGNLLVTAFHPELTGDSRFHRFFAQMTADALAAGDRAA